MVSVLPVRSTFVTVLAWVFIGLAGFVTLISILQNIMLQLVFAPAMAQAHLPPMAGPLPEASAWMLGHIAWFFRLILVLSATLLAASIGLLLRRNWARLLFITMLVLGIAYQAFGVVMQWWVLGSMTDTMLPPPNAPADVMHGMQAMMIVMRVFGVLFAVAISALFAWLIYRLTRPGVLAEFGAAP